MSLRAVSVLSLLAAALTACDKPPPGAAVIGYAFPRTEQRAALVAAATLPADSGPGAIRIVGDWDSGGTESGVEIARAHRLITLPRMMGVVGHTSSRGTLVTAPIYEEARVPLVVPTATASVLWDAGPYIFPLAPTDSLEAAFLGTVALDVLGARRLTVFFTNTAYGAGIRARFNDWLDGRGVSPLDEVPYVSGADFATLVEASLSRGRPDLVLLVGRQDDVSRLAALVYERDPSIALLAADGGYDQPADWVDEAGAVADSLYFVTFWVADTTDPVQEGFIRRYRLESGRDPPPFEAMRFDAVMVLAEAIRQVGPDRERIRDWLASLGRERPPYPGVTGPIAFGKGLRRNLYLIRLRDGKPVQVPVPGEKP